ncbi:MAG: hypothetical protein ACXVPN_01255 [Bacteroidia bacterium]
MELFIKASVLVHVIAGGLALLCGLIAILFRKDTRSHRPFGRVYFWCMTVVFITAVYVSTYRGNLFLFCIACFSYYSCITAFRSLRLKFLHKGQKAKTIDWAIEWVFGIIHVGFTGLGVFLWVNGNKQFGIICLVFGLTGLRINYLSNRRLKGDVEYSNYWLLAHIGGMLGSYIAAITAFLVNNNLWMRMPGLVAWLSPTVILVPLLIYELQRVKKKGKLIR